VSLTGANRNDVTPAPATDRWPAGGALIQDARDGAAEFSEPALVGGLRGEELHVGTPVAGETLVSDALFREKQRRWNVRSLQSARASKG